jgi:hypothetical protein
MVPAEDRARISNLGFRQAPQSYTLKTASDEVLLQIWPIGLTILYLPYYVKRAKQWSRALTQLRVDFHPVTESAL